MTRCTHSLFTLFGVFVVTISASIACAQDSTRVPTIGPEFLLGSAFPQTSTLQPITAYQLGIRGYYPIGTNLALRLEASYRHLEIQEVSPEYSYEFEGSYLFIGPALRYKWLELGVDYGVPLGGNFGTYGGTLADTNASLERSSMSSIFALAGNIIFPIVQNDRNEFSVILGASSQVSSMVMTRHFTLHAKSSLEPVLTTPTTLGPISTIVVGVTWQFNLWHKDGDGW